jgi:hypothetical protein
VSVSSPCEICNTAAVRHTCGRCGQLVCDRHFDEDTGRCVECAARVTGGDHEDVPSGEDMPDGVDTYRL